MFFPKFTAWMCSTNRNGLNPCRGTVSLRDDHFLIKISHNKPPNNYLEDTIRLRNEVKKKALESIFDSAKYIVEDVLKDFHLKNPMLFWRIELGKIQGRKILRIFSSWLIKNSFQINFIGENYFVELRKVVGNIWYLSQIHTLSFFQSKTVVYRRDIKIVDKNVFQQLFSIHVFICKGSSTNQDSLAFVSWQVEKPPTT